MATAAPSRYVPPRRSALSGWQLPNLRLLSQDLSRYGGGGRPGYASVNFPQSGFALTSPENPYLNMADGALSPTPTPTPAPAPAPEGFDSIDSPMSPALTTAPEAPNPNIPEVVWPDPQEADQPPANAGQTARQEWMERGGSSRTYNRANVARGVRSSVDARSNPSPRNSTASADIRSSWGWGAGPMDLPY